VSSFLEIGPSQRLKTIYNTPDEKSAIKAICRQLLHSLNLDTAPIPLKPICQRFRLKVNYTTAYTREDSFLKITPTGFEIQISKQKNWRRNRFTIAHEISHLIIFNAINIPINSNDIKQHNEIEKLCDIGASEILMNEDELEKNLKKYGLNTIGLKIIYDKFMVSYDALFMKLSDFFGASILIWKNYARHDYEAKEFRVYRHFPKYTDAEKAIWLPNGCTAKHISPNPFVSNFDNKELTIIEDFKLIMNEKITKCSAIAFMFPHSRNVNLNLPIFDNLIISDEPIYDDCVVMFVLKDKDKLHNLKKNYLKNDV
jgi:Zn-dependent peptidase ImmA (M78 family)